jgi:prevent-host-death family protein
MSPVLYNLGMTKVSTAVARKQFSDMVNRASYAKERVALTRYGKTLAAIVPAEDLAWLEAMEDRIDSEDAEKALAEMKTKGEKPIPWATVKKRLGL